MAIIIDIDGLRDQDPVLLQQDLKILKQFNFLVAHNEAMKAYLAARLPSSRIICIQLFDYPAPEIPIQRELSATLSIAANFRKASYVYQLHQLNSVSFNLYGQDYDPHETTVAPNIHYHGAIAAVKLPSILKGSFGLIWDGDSITHCDEYLRYNNPHKLSVYLAAALPVMAGKQSAVAPWIVQEQIGLLIDDLEEIPACIAQLSAASYQQLQQNAARWGTLVRSGHFLKSVCIQIGLEENE